MAGPLDRIKPKIEHIRLESDSFSALEELIRYRGTHHMRNELHWMKELAIQTAAKSFSEQDLRENQENFLVKLQTLRYVNGFDDVADLDFSEIQRTWHSLVLSLVDDFLELKVFDYDENMYVLQINVVKFTDRYIDLERTLYRRARGPYD